MALPGPTATAMPVDVQLVSTMDTPDAALLEGWAEDTLSRAQARAPGALPAEAGELCLRVVDEEESRRLNREYRHKDAPTNVLSFPAGIDLPDVLVWGDIVVCAPVVAREAAAQGKTYDHHFAHMVVHGVLHLLGYDHQSAADAAVMERLEIEILDGFGVSDPYGEG